MNRHVSFSRDVDAIESKVAGLSQQQTPPPVVANEPSLGLELPDDIDRPATREGTHTQRIIGLLSLVLDEQTAKQQLDSGKEGIFDQGLSPDQEAAFVLAIRTYLEIKREEEDFPADIQIAAAPPDMQLTTYLRDGAAQRVADEAAARLQQQTKAQTEAAEQQIQYCTEAKQLYDNTRNNVIAAFSELSAARDQLIERIKEHGGKDLSGYIETVTIKKRIFSKAREEDQRHYYKIPFENPSGKPSYCNLFEDGTVIYDGYISDQLRWFERLLDRFLGKEAWPKGPPKGIVLHISEEALLLFKNEIIFRERKVISEIDNAKRALRSFARYDAGGELIHPTDFIE